MKLGRGGTKIKGYRRNCSMGAMSGRDGNIFYSCIKFPMNK